LLGRQEKQYLSEGVLEKLQTAMAFSLKEKVEHPGAMGQGL
jgi:hypothetical protein